MTIVEEFSVGDGDTLDIHHVFDNFTIVDCSLLEDRHQESIEVSKGKGITHFISRLPDKLPPVTRAGLRNA